MAKDHGITGTWRGHYTYMSAPDEGSNFDAIFVENKGSLKGEIRDEGILGHSVVSGTFGFPKVSFVKTYFTRGLDPIHYEGTMSGDGKTISGRWTIRMASGQDMKGTWMAHRTDNEEKKKEKLEESQTNDLEKVR